MKNPVNAINHYLSFVLLAAQTRNDNFDASKIAAYYKKSTLTVTKGQLSYEAKYLLKKLKTRDPEKFKQVKSAGSLKPHSLFRIKKGGIENWEII